MYIIEILKMIYFLA